MKRLASPEDTSASENYAYMNAAELKCYEREITTNSYKQRFLCQWFTSRHNIHDEHDSCYVYLTCYFPIITFPNIDRIK